MRNVELLPTRDCEAGYGPVSTTRTFAFSFRETQYHKGGSNSMTDIDATFLLSMDP